MRFYWVSLFTAFLLGEAYAVIYSKDTLSATWLWAISSLPAYAAVPLTALTGGALLWLLGPHWILRAYDAKGFDVVEILTIIVGVLIGALGGLAITKKEKKENEG